MRIVGKFITIIVVVAGMLPTVFGIMVTMSAFGYTRSEARYSTLSYGSLVLIIGAGVIFLGVLIWQFQVGEFNAKKMAGNCFTIIGILCIIAAIVNLLYSAVTGSPLLIGKEYIYFVTIIFGAGGMVVGKRLSNVTKSLAGS